MGIQVSHPRQGFFFKALSAIEQNAKVSVHVALDHQLNFLQFICIELVSIKKLGLCKMKESQYKEEIASGQIIVTNPHP